MKKLKFIIPLFCIVVLSYSAFNISKWNKNKVIQWDITSYYGYLPAYFIHNDLTLKFIDEDPKYYYDNMMFWPEKAPNGNYVIKTTMGMSLLYAPFFGIAQLEASFFKEDLNGFSPTYQKWIQLSAIFYLFFGIFYLFKYLSCLTNDLSASIAIIVVLFGTNLFYYSSMESAMSHSYNFALISCFIYWYDNWIKKNSMKSTLILGVITGLIVLIRPTNIFILIFAFFYSLNSFDLKYQLVFLFKKRLKSVLIIMLISFIVLLPQFVYWKIQTDYWVFNSYVGEHFYFLKPHLINFLFGFRKGWFIYTPLMIIPSIGILMLFKINHPLKWAISIPIVISVYLLSSWWCWWFGGSFGMRSLIDWYPLMTIVLAIVIYRSKNKIILCSLCLILVTLNLIQTYQYHKGIMHWDSMTFKSYKNIFLTLKNSNSNTDFLETPNYSAAKKGKEE